MRYATPVRSPGTGDPEARLSITFCTLGCVAIVGYLVIPTKEVRDVAYLTLAATFVAVILVGVRMNRPELRLPWYLMAAGEGLWVLGDTVYTLLEDVFHKAPFPSVADAFYLTGYPVIALGVYLLIRGRSSHRDVAGMLDAAIVTAGLGLLSWVLLAQPTIAASEDSALAAAVAAAYPSADILLVAGLVWLLTTSDGPLTALRLLLVAIALVIVADTLYLTSSLFGTGESFAIDFMWLMSYLLWGTAALHPSMASMSRPTPSVVAPVHRRRLVAMTLAALAAPGILAAQRLTGTRLDVWAVIIGSAVLFLLVVARLKVAVDVIAAVNVQLEQLQEQFAFQATHDELTTLPNRAYAVRLVSAALNRAQRSGGLVALLFIDLDRFKAINDRYGHRSGDEVLRTVAKRLSEQVRAGDIAARLGGDEFVMLLDNVGTEASAVRTGQRVIAAISRPIRLNMGAEVDIGASIGIGFNKVSSTDADALLHEADLAVYRAKSHGGGHVEVFSQSQPGLPDLPLGTA